MFPPNSPEWRSILGPSMRTSKYTNPRKPKTIVGLSLLIMPASGLRIMSHFSRSAFLLIKLSREGEPTSSSPSRMNLMLMGNSPVFKTLSSAKTVDMI